MKDILLFLFSYLFTLLLYELFVVKRVKKKKKKNKKNDKPMEVIYLEKKYKLDLKKINYNRLLHVVAIVSSFDIAIVVTFISVVNSYVIGIIGGFIMMIVLIIVSYHLIYLVYKKKGMIIDEWYFKNRKEMAKVLGKE